MSLYEQLLQFLELDAYLDDWAIPNPGECAGDGAPELAVTQ